MSNIKERQIAKGDLGTKRMYEELDAKGKRIPGAKLQGGKDASMASRLNDTRKKLANLAQRARAEDDPTILANIKRQLDEIDNEYFGTTSTQETRQLGNTINPESNVQSLQGIDKDTGENLLDFVAPNRTDAGVELYWRGGTSACKKLETTEAGVTITGALSVTDDITAFYSSDRRLKDNISPIKQALDKVKSLSGNTFDWNEASGKEGSDTGVIAQEVEALNLPGVTTIRDDGTHAVRYERLVPVLIEAVKELSAKVDNLEQKLSDK